MAAMKMTSSVPQNGTDAQIAGLPQLLRGELVLSTIWRVLKHGTIDRQGAGVMGSLHVTNFKMAFTVANQSGSQRQGALSRRMSQSGKRKGLFVPGSVCGDDYVPLPCITRLVALCTTRAKRKVLTSSKAPSAKYDLLEVHTKDLRILQFDLSLCPETRRAFFSTLVHYAFPDTVQRLFTFDYCRAKTGSREENLQRAFHTFRHSKDYELLLTTQECQRVWRVSRMNKGFSVSRSLPELNVLPQAVADEELAMLALFYEDGRLPTWEWSDPHHGFSLLTCGSLKPSRSSFYTSSQSKPGAGHPELIITSIQATSRGVEHRTEVEVISVESLFPTLPELKQSFLALQKMCRCRSGEEYWLAEESWLGKLEGCGWLEFVNQGLDCTLTVIRAMTEEHKSVILEEPQGRDYTCVVASLVQICLDPFFRTILGLQSLIQKSWVAKGHKFLDRLAHLHSRVNKRLMAIKTEVNSDDPEDALVNEEEAPVFPLFINCLHTLLCQHPSRFEYNENFLLMLIDCSHACLFDTFLFNSEYQRSQVTSDLSLDSLWDFLSNDVDPYIFDQTFVNPLTKVVALEKEFKDLLQRSPTPSTKQVLAPTALENNHTDFKKDSDLAAMRSSNSQRACSAALDFDLRHILPDVNVLHNDLWCGYFLRWLPKFDSKENGDFRLRKQQNTMIEELEYLEDRLSRLLLFLDFAKQGKSGLNDDMQLPSWRKEGKIALLKGELDGACATRNFNFYALLHELQS